MVSWGGQGWVLAAAPLEFGSLLAGNGSSHLEWHWEMLSQHRHPRAAGLVKVFERAAMESSFSAPLRAFFFC